MESEILRVSAPGKVILHGEHSVVYGKTALAVSVDLRTTISLYKNSLELNIGENLEIRLKDLSETYKFPLSILKTIKCSECAKLMPGLIPMSNDANNNGTDDNLLSEISKIIVERYPEISGGTKCGLTALLYLYLNIVVDMWSLDDDLEPLLLEINSQIPIGAGLGSSAAYAVSLAGAFYYYRWNMRAMTSSDNGKFMMVHEHEILSIGESISKQINDINAEFSNNHMKSEEPLVPHPALSEMSQDGSSGISSRASSASLSPPATPSPVKHLHQSFGENESNNETDDEDFINVVSPTKQFNSNKLDYDEICKWAFLAEKVIHGNPSGIDNTICTYGGLLTYRNRQIVSVQTPSCQDNDAIPLIPLRILLINTKVPKNTKVQVANVRSLVNLLPSITDRILDAMDEVAINCLETLSLLSDIKPENVKQNNISKGNEKDNSSLQLYQKLEELIDVNQGLLKTIGVSHPSLDLVQELTAKQKLHSKLTGAGGGGFAFALVTPNHEMQQIQAAKDELLRNGFECWEAQIGCHGLLLEEVNKKEL